METRGQRDRYTKGQIYFFSSKWANFSRIQGINHDHIHASPVTLVQDHQPQLRKAITYALATDFTTIETGRYPIDGENVLAIVNEYTTKPASECDPESHRDYADIQIMVTGAERFGYTPLIDQPASTPYRPENDVAFYSIPSEALNYITLLPGQFIIFFPSDIHQPEVFLQQPGLVRKVVLKVALQPMANFSTTSVE